jgi:hypothetical protein
VAEIVSAAVGIPEIVPSDERERPFGREPLVIDQE